MTMTTIDMRTRYEGDQALLDPVEFLEGELQERVAENGAEAAGIALQRNLPALTLAVDGTELTLSHDHGSMTARPGAGGALTVDLDRAAFSDLMQDVASGFGLQMMGRATVRSGDLESLLQWEPVLRCLLDGRPAYRPGSIDFRDRSGAPLDLRTSFRADSDPREMGHFLAEAGFLHVAGVFTLDEMAAVSAELDEAIAAADRDDGASWWARTASGEWYASRILGFNQKSPTLRELLQSVRFTALGKLTDDTYIQRDPLLGDSAEGLLKKVGVVEGISDVSWHKDCSMGGHSLHCCGMTVGISVTGAGRHNGELGVVPGSHRANIALLGVAGLDLPRLPLPTQTGDITVHCSCTLHMSRPPESAERRVVYTGFGLAPRTQDRHIERTAAEIRQDRHSLNDRVISGQAVRSMSTSAGFEL
jgi:hypothetical protein